ncbi:conserved protein, unknown function, partial [Hepatocystis sp. ex Piliocolobus tephrosceles]
DNIDFSSIRNTKTNKEQVAEKPAFLKRLEELRKKKKLAEEEKKKLINNNVTDKGVDKEKKTEEVLKKTIKQDTKEVEISTKVMEVVKKDEVATTTAAADTTPESEIKDTTGTTPEAETTGIPVTKTDIPATKTDIPATKTDIPATTTDIPATTTDIHVTTTDIPVTTTDTAAASTAKTTTIEVKIKKKFIPKRLLMYQEELKKKEEQQRLLELKQKEEQKKLLELKKNEKKKLLSTITATSSSAVFIPRAKLLHMKNLETSESTKKTSKIEVLKNNKEKVDSVQLKSKSKKGDQEKNISLFIAEHTENVKIVEKDEEEHIIKKKQELYQKQLDKINKKNEENLKYNKVYKYNLDTIKAFYQIIQEKINQNCLISQDDCVNICSPLKTEECNYLESHVPFYVLISTYMLNLQQKCEDSVYLDKAKNLKELFLYLKQNSKIENHDDYILSDTVKMCADLKYPYLSEETSLVEAVFDSLLYLGIISKDSFIKWFAEDNLDSELKNKIMLQLIYWHKWMAEDMTDDENEDMYNENLEETEEKVNDISDIEKDVPANFVFKKIKKKYL